MPTAGPESRLVSLGSAACLYPGWPYKRAQRIPLRGTYQEYP